MNHRDDLGATNFMLEASGVGDAAEAGDPDAQFKLGVYCEEHGEGDQAIHWYSKAAQRGNSDAMRRLMHYAERGIAASGVSLG